ncbi:hypothetical protein [Persicitalea jodogahamensis]|uniref:Uncharacterized protein n=1 Tax=Persicitalea jodogahamensis TaxID=402147 RepID=A0A8J3G9X7_9BACT|nr:hypothetical protein [Persicitalea jodogahamensis]GHB70195.1 hypothetical protein GCM10007390_24770 [Persicitalea jodogahamensis]
MSHITTPKDAFIAEIASYQQLDPAAESFVRERLRVTDYERKGLQLLYMTFPTSIF